MAGVGLRTLARTSRRCPLMLVVDRLHWGGSRQSTGIAQPGTQDPPAMITTSITKPPSWRFATLAEWEAEQQDWQPNPEDDYWARVMDTLDWSEFTLLASVAKYPEGHREPSPNARIWAYKNDLGLNPFEVIRDQLVMLDGLNRDLHCLRGPEPTQLGGYDGYSATYTYWFEQKLDPSFTVLHEAVAIQVGEKMILGCFEGPANSITQQDRQELLEIRASVRFTLDEAPQPPSLR